MPGPVEEIQANGYNLDMKNPHKSATEQHEPEHLLAAYHSLLAEVAQAREALRCELAASLEETVGTIRVEPTRTG